jgi:hypothetical protein
MDCIPKRRLAGTAALALLVGATFASPAAGQSRCTAPAKAGAWHSCLSTSHRAIDGGPEVRLVQARPRLVERYERCRARTARRSVVIRTGDGDRLGRESVRGRCKRGVTRWIVNLRLNVDLQDGDVVRSYWSGIADSGDGAPKVELKVD